MAGFSVTKSSLYFKSSLEANVPIHTVLMHAFGDRGTVVLSRLNFGTRCTHTPFCYFHIPIFYSHTPIC